MGDFEHIIANNPGLTKKAQEVEARFARWEKMPVTVKMTGAQVTQLLGVWAAICAGSATRHNLWVLEQMLFRHLRMVAAEES